AAPALSLRGDVGANRLTSQRQLLSVIDRAQRLTETSSAMRDFTIHQRKAYDLLTSRQAKAAFDLRAEPDAVRARYGPGINAMSMLLARRLVEAGVPFVTVFWKDDRELDRLCNSGGGWDTHGNNFNCLKDRLLPEFDRPFAALLEDLHRRGLLETTLVLVSSERGGRPRIGDPRSGGPGGAGRDHRAACRSGRAAGRGVPAGRSIPPTTPSPPSTSPGRSSMPWASTSCRPPTARAGRSHSSKKAGPLPSCFESPHPRCPAGSGSTSSKSTVSGASPALLED